MRGVVNLLKRVYSLLIALYALGLHSRLAVQWRYNPPPADEDHSFESLASYHQWNMILKRLKPLWKITCTISALFISLSIHVDLF